MAAATASPVSSKPRSHRFDIEDLFRAPQRHRTYAADRDRRLNLVDTHWAFFEGCY
jgi:hypothetical protein